MVGTFLAEQCVARKAADPGWLAGMELVIVPVSNPDGYEYSLTVDAMWRKNRNPLSGSSCIGVDLNRNWGTDWSGGQSTSTSECSHRYVGPSAHSEPETQALKALLEEAPLHLHLDLHSYGQMILGPWGHTNADHPDKATIDAVGLEIQSAIENATGQTYLYATGDAGGALYLASGIMPDYSTALGAYGYTLELPPGTWEAGGFFPPASGILPAGQDLLEAVGAVVGRLGPAPPLALPTPTPALCGAKGPDDTPWGRGGRIVGGQDATLCEWKWQVSLSSPSLGAFPMHVCGGTLIAESWVLTAAHCTDWPFSVVAGLHRQSAADSAQVGLEVHQVHVHPLFNSSTFSFDFALVELADVAPLGDCIGLACLPSEDVVGGEECFITGWGALSSGGSLSDLLQEAEVAIVSNPDCDAAYGNGMISDGMVCAQGLNSAGQVTDACQGDSGGPLVCGSGAGAYTLHGVTSWGYGCASAAYPGVWSRVNYVRDWLDEMMGMAPQPTPAPPPSPAPPPTPAPPPAPALAYMWAEIVGECTLDGACVESPNYPQDYDPDQMCILEINLEQAAPLVVEGFATESYFDTLTVNGLTYSGTSGPSGITPTSSILWMSDFFIQHGGWRLCVKMPTPAPQPTLAPTPIPILTSAPTPAPLCGVKGPDDTPWTVHGDRIVGGQDATPCEWKWQVSLSSPSFGHFCGGTLIADSWVLTAAHCMGWSFSVIAGLHSQSAADSTQVGLEVHQVHVHPLYKSATFAHDFALVELADAAPLGDCIGLACLPSEDVVGGEECFTTGWGTLSHGGPSPDLLQEAGVTVVSSSDCDAIFGSAIIKDDMVCAFGLNSAGHVTDACQGDSGGPLVCGSSTGVYTLHGATSWGYGCASATYPGVWSRVNYVRDWVDDVMGLTPQPTPASPPAPAPAPDLDADGSNGASTPSPTPTSPPTSAPLCGAKGPDGTPWHARGQRIVGGQDATPCEWKWQVSLTTLSGSHFCGGTLVAPGWVLTAAHCVQRGGSFYVVAGSHSQHSTDATEAVLQVQQVYSHPLFSPSTLEYDFTMVELADTAPLNDCIGVACLPSDDVHGGDECFITGWGTLSHGGSSPDLLQEAKVAIVNNSDCDTAYGTGMISDDMLCAQGLNSAGQVTDACQGDSGGPLVCVSGSGAYALHGATSWGYGCASALYPGVWSRVNYVRDWIDAVMGTTAPTSATVTTLTVTNSATRTPVRSSTTGSTATSTSSAIGTSKTAIFTSATSETGASSSFTSKTVTTRTTTSSATRATMVFPTDTGTTTSTSSVTATSETDTFSPVTSETSTSTSVTSETSSSTVVTSETGTFTSGTSETGTSTSVTSETSTSTLVTSETGTFTSGTSETITATSVTSETGTHTSVTTGTFLSGTSETGTSGTGTSASTTGISVTGSSVTSIQ
ncbi:unnamed protein product [Prorocentrum cordatum]|uniref:Subtilisin n=1 Tax=Prorocentrum cordatum TaxID=2364126 RepID=A0ABN9S5M6_9DINO|nr:unnamed protein product [Polarella glacialis]